MARLGFAARAVQCTEEALKNFLTLFQSPAPGDVDLYQKASGQLRLLADEGSQALKCRSQAATPAPLFGCCPQEGRREPLDLDLVGRHITVCLALEEAVELEAVAAVPIQHVAHRDVAVAEFAAGGKHRLQRLRADPGDLLGLALVHSAQLTVWRRHAWIAMGAGASFVGCVSCHRFPVGVVGTQSSPPPAKP